MKRLDRMHIEVEKGDNWGTVATALGVSRNDLAAHNGATVKGTSVTPALAVGRILHAPLVVT